MAARIVLAVRESEYIEPLLHYVHHSEYAEMLRITAFSRMEPFMQFMSGDEKPDAVVGDPAFIEAWLVTGKITLPWAILSDGGGGGRNTQLAGGAAIEKYQSLPRLLEAILRLCDVSRVRTAPAAGGGPLLLGVVSASGSSGKTTVALNLAKHLGGLGLSVFYLNLESIDSSVLTLRTPAGQKQGLEALLYELKSAGQDTAPLAAAPLPDIGSYAVRNEELRCDLFRPAENFKELLELTAEDTKRLLGLFTEGRRYDLVIIDTGGLEEGRTQAVLESSGMLLWLAANTGTSLYKTARWLELARHPHSGLPADLVAKSRLVMNEVSAAGAPLPVPEGMAIELVLPFIPYWAQQSHVELSLSSPQFQAAVQQLCSALIEPALAHVFTGAAR